MSKSPDWIAVSHITGKFRAWEPGDAVIRPPKTIIRDNGITTTETA